MGEDQDTGVEQFNQQFCQFLIRMGYSLPVIRNHSRKVRPAKTGTSTRHIQSFRGARGAPRETRAGRGNLTLCLRRLAHGVRVAPGQRFFKSSVNGGD